MGGVFSSSEERVVSEWMDSGNTTLSLSGMNLLIIPKIPQTEQLKTLKLFSNNITSESFIESCSDLLKQPCIEKLFVASNSLGNLENIRLPYSLEEIDLGRNKITHFSLQHPEKLHLTDISLDYNSFIEFPINLLLIQTLKRLSLSHNEINYIPNIEKDLNEKIKKISHLKSLILDNNNFKSLPKLDCLSNLEQLSVHENGIECITEDDIAIYQQLTYLCISNNKIFSFDINNGIDKLQFLDLMGNKLKEVCSLSHLKCLKSLTLRNNELSFLPSLPNSLRSLNIQDNNFKEFPTNIPLDYSLHEILTNRNPFTSVPEKIIKKQFDTNFVCDYTVPNLILPGLYLGSEEGALNKNILDEINISHILKVKSTGDIPFPNDFIYKVIPIGDVSSENISKYFDEAFDFIDSCLESNNNVLVHCAQGVSRSGSIVISYIMRKQNISFNDALLFVKSKRPIVSPNNGFIKQLEELETKIIIRDI